MAWSCRHDRPEAYIHLINDRIGSEREVSAVSRQDAPLRYSIGPCARRSALPRERFGPLIHNGPLLALKRSVFATRS
jgi:hypothetical protein